MRKFSVPYDPKGVGYNVFKHHKLVIQPGITVLTGCNGAGKSTLIQYLNHQLQKAKILTYSYDNHRDGGDYAMSCATFSGDFSTMSGLLSSSEGEGILINLGNVMGRIGTFVHTGDISSILPKRILGADSLNSYNTSEFWIFLDASDSGLSLDNVQDIKKLLHIIVDDLTNAQITPYIIVSCNEYEMCIGERCLEVCDFKYHTYKSYNAFQKAIMKSRAYKDEQIRSLESSEEEE